MGRQQHMDRKYQRYALDIIRRIKAEREEEDRDRAIGTFEYHGHCIHGVYVGGCGIDWMCQWCEGGWTLYEYARHHAQMQRDRDRQASLEHIVTSMFTRTGIEWQAFTREERDGFADHLCAALAALAPDRNTRTANTGTADTGTVDPGRAAA
jgi:hypothetical protein